jgi:hypothetical protein
MNIHIYIHPSNYVYLQSDTLGLLYGWLAADSSSSTVSCLRGKGKS